MRGQNGGEPQQMVKAGRTERGGTERMRRRSCWQHTTVRVRRKVQRLNVYGSHVPARLTFLQRCVHCNTCQKTEHRENTERNVSHIK